MGDWNFPGPLAGREAKSLRELKIDRLCDALRARPEWRCKCSQKHVVAAWLAEAREQNVSATEFKFAMQVRHPVAGCGTHDSAWHPCLAGDHEHWLQ